MRSSLKGREIIFTKPGAPIIRAFLNACVAGPQPQPQPQPHLHTFLALKRGSSAIPTLHKYLFRLSKLIFEAAQLLLYEINSLLEGEKRERKEGRREEEQRVVRKCFPAFDQFGLFFLLFGCCCCLHFNIIVNNLSMFVISSL